VSATVVPPPATPSAASDTAPTARRVTAGLVPATCAAVAFLLYAVTVSGGVGWDDQAELAAGIDRMGSVHATGYPIYLLLGKAFEVVLPFASASLAASLFSALCAAAAVGLVAQLARAQTGSDLGAVASAIALGGGSVLWANAATASVYALFLVSLLLLLLAVRRWDKEQSPVNLACVSAAVGVVVVSHRTGLPFAAATIAYVAWTAPRTFLTPRTLPAVLAGVVPLATLSYVWLRTGSGVWPDTPKLFGMTPWETINGGPGRLAPEAKLFGATSSELVTHVKSLVVLTPTQLSLAAVLLAPLGLPALRRDRSFLVVGLIPSLIVSAMVLTTPMGFVYWHVPLMAAGAILVGAGVATLQQRVGAGARPFVAVAVLVALLTGPLYGYRYVSRHHDDASAWARTVLDRLPRDATIVAPWSAYAPLRATQVLEHRRPDVSVRYSPTLINTTAALGRQHASYVVAVSPAVVAPPAGRHASMLVAPVDVDIKAIQDMNVGGFGITAPMGKAAVYAFPAGT
jgi:hypothetical protein